jgi:hypothetical protein
MLRLDYSGVPEMTRSPIGKTASFGYLIWLLLVPFALGQAVPRKPFPKEPLEKLDNPPALYWGTGVSSRMVSQYGIFTSRQVNVNASGQNIVGDAANEPSICVDPTNPNKMSIGWRQFNSVTSNFRQAGWAYTNNGGTTWTFPGVLENNVFRSDPVLNANSIGRFFYLSLLATFFDDMWRSLNGGVSWANIAPARGGDKEWFTIDNTNSTGHGFQYQCWSTEGNNYGSRQFTRSTNGGLIWMDPINIPNSPAWGTLDVDSNGNLFIGGVNLATGGIWCVRSTNAKNGAILPTFDQSTAVNLGGNIVAGEPINPEGLVGQVFLAVDRSGTSTNNNVYMLASVQPARFTDGSDVMFARSTDGGRTFGAPHRINDDPVNHLKWHWFGALSVAPNGRIDVVWFDTRNAPNNTDSQLFYSYSIDGGNTWSPNVAVSNSFNPFLGYPNQNKLGDYITAVSDNAGANVAYAATFNGEEDIYYVRVAPVSVSTTLYNISTRAFVQTGENVMIGGFIITGAGQKRVIVRGIGPSLVSYGINDPLQDPTLELHDSSGAIIASNDNWMSAPNVQEIIDSGLAPGNNLESAILMNLNPGAYTAIVRGVNAGTGVGLAEVYDLDLAAGSKLGNISTRAFVQTGDNVMIGGFIVSGVDSGRVIVRAIGPSLVRYGISDPLQNPTLELHDSSGAIVAFNDNWMSAPNVQEIIDSGYAPSNNLESAILMRLAPGAYTAIVRGVNATTGVALVEAYGLQ